MWYHIAPLIVRHIEGDTYQEYYSVKLKGASDMTALPVCQMTWLIEFIPFFINRSESSLRMYYLHIHLQASMCVSLRYITI